MNNKKVLVPGESGKIYQLLPFSLDTQFNDVSALYIFARKVNNKYYPLYIGETGELGTRLKNHEKLNAALKLGCNCFLISRIDEKYRIDAETDLRHNYDTKLNRQ